MMNKNHTQAYEDNLRGKLTTLSDECGYRMCFYIEWLQQRTEFILCKNLKWAFFMCAKQYIG